MRAQVYESLVGFIVSELCPRCHAHTRAGFCRRCRHEFVANPRPCRVCGQQPLPAQAAECVDHPQPWITNAVRAPLVYCEPLDRYVYAMKFSGQRKIARALGMMLADSVTDARTGIDALVPVPLHSSRLIERGFNQAFEIARVISLELRIPILRAGIMRRTSTPAQTKLRAASRRRNLRFAFAVDRKLHAHRLAIVDDVITTGATVNSLALALRAAGASYVEAWAVARTPRPVSPISRADRK